MQRWILALTAFLSSVVVQPHAAEGQPPRAPRDTTIDAATRAQIIDTLVARLDAGSVFPEKAAEMAKDLRTRAARGDYNSLTSAIGFADTLTAHLQAVSHDKPLRVRHSDRALLGGAEGVGLLVGSDPP